MGNTRKGISKEFLIKVYKNLNVDENFRFTYAEDVYLLVNSMFYRPKYTILKYDGYLYYNNPTSITMQDLSENTIPTCVFHGKQDGVVDVRQSEHLVKA